MAKVSWRRESQERAQEGGLGAPVGNQGGLCGGGGICSELCGTYGEGR